MGVCASKPKTKDDHPVLQGGNAPETPRPKKEKTLVVSSGQLEPAEDAYKTDPGAAMAYLHVEPKHRESELDKMLLAANPADFEREVWQEESSNNWQIDRIAEEETYSSYSECSTNGRTLSAKEIQLRKDQINALGELEKHLEDDIISTLESRADATSPSKLKHRFLVDAQSLEFPMSPRHQVDSAESLLGAQQPDVEKSEKNLYKSPTFQQRFTHQSFESFKVYAPELERDSGNAHDEDTDLESESSLTESMQVCKVYLNLIIAI